MELLREPLPHRIGGLKDGQIFQQRDNADDDDDDLHDLLDAGFDRQSRHQIKHQEDNQKRDQNADEKGHVSNSSVVRLATPKRKWAAPTPWRVRQQSKRAVLACIFLLSAFGGVTPNGAVLRMRKSPKGSIDHRPSTVDIAGASLRAGTMPACRA
jgi:hypothetical protein